MKLKNIPPHPYQIGDYSFSYRCLDCNKLINNIIEEMYEIENDWNELEYKNGVYEGTAYVSGLVICKKCATIRSLEGL